MALSWRARRLLGPLGPRLWRAAFATPGLPLHASAAPCQQAEHPKPVPMRKLKDSFLDGTSSTYLEELEQRYQADPRSVDKTWASFFNSLDSGVAPEAVAEAYHKFERGETASPLTAVTLSAQTIQESMKLVTLVRAYQVHGHGAATLDPLGLDNRTPPPFLDPAYYGFKPSDMDREFVLGQFGLDGFLGENKPIVKLGDIVKRLKEVYCGNVGYEYMHIPDREKCNWIRDKIETLAEVKY
ncbi:unnamed protein product [Ostreobium quekettii]|uniref:2-oxoglutarate dehydrogenase, mitochondrial n=1 Tax=Ostreobium quekettii TaxID=121088 RepID=A0A8S1JET4_9CHLO|nr:unnamed protein product [Ostreobium quekettii]